MLLMGSDGTGYDICGEGSKPADCLTLEERTGEEWTIWTASILCKTESTNQCGIPMPTQHLLHFTGWQTIPNQVVEELSGYIHFTYVVACETV
jgi:hypothetical protein